MTDAEREHATVLPLPRAFIVAEAMKDKSEKQGDRFGQWRTGMRGTLGCTMRNEKRRTGRMTLRRHLFCILIVLAGCAPRRASSNLVVYDLSKEPEQIVVEKVISFDLDIASKEPKQTLFSGLPVGRRLFRFEYGVSRIPGVDASFPVGTWLYEVAEVRGAPDEYYILIGGVPSLQFHALKEAVLEHAESHLKGEMAKELRGYRSDWQEQQKLN